MLKKKKRYDFDHLKQVDKLEYCKKVFKPGVIFNNSEAIGYERNDIKIEGDGYKIHVRDSGNIMVSIGSKKNPMNWTLYHAKRDKFAKIV